MRVVLSIVMVVLVLIAILGIGFGIYIGYQGAQARGAGETIVVLAMAAVPFAVGTIALGSVAVVMAVENSQHETAGVRASVDRVSAIVMNEAKIAELRRASQGS